MFLFVVYLDIIYQHKTSEVKMDCSVLLKSLSKRGFYNHFAENIADANEYIKKLIPKGASIGFGGSVTVDQMKLLDELKSDYRLLHRSFYPPEEHTNVMAEMHTADWYICSVNGITEGGELVNIDGRGNRVAETLYGPKNVLFVLGINKITKNLEDAISRSRNVAAPPNCVRLNKKTPCAVTGRCENCNSPDTICKATVIMHHPMTGKNVYVLVVNENLGY